MAKSAIWRHFTEIDSEKKVTCLYCPQQLSVANKSTCSLIRHMNKKHSNVNVRDRSSTEAQSSQEDILLLNTDGTTVNSEFPETPVLEYGIQIHGSEVEEEDSELDQKPSTRNSSESKPNNRPVEQQVIAAMTEAKRQIEDALLSIKTVNKRKTENEDEYDHFGHMIASKIRKIRDMEKREIVMHSVYNVVYQALIKNV